MSHFFWVHLAAEDLLLAVREPLFEDLVAAEFVVADGGIFNPCMNVPEGLEPSLVYGGSDQRIA